MVTKSKSKYHEINIHSSVHMQSSDEEGDYLLLKHSQDDIFQSKIQNFVKSIQDNKEVGQSPAKMEKPEYKCSKCSLPILRNQTIQEILLQKVSFKMY